MNSYTRKKNKVHAETDLVKDIIEMAAYCGSAKMIAKVLKCSHRHVNVVRAQSKSSAHIFLTKTNIEALRRADR